MNLLGTKSSGEFLSDHWQKSPLFLERALGGRLPELPPEELAWLATQPDVESRLVFTEGLANKLQYRVESGPFEEQYLGSLPPSDWTLLVQDVDKHLPDFRSYFSMVDFVPDWRIDDLMVSFAAPGGSVGPHLDNYDVFLCQGLGSRDWHLTNPDDARPEPDSGDLALLAPFEGSSRYAAASGDVLYLPPGVPHWGVASEACVTYSIGMRAPTAVDIVLAAQRMFPTRNISANRDDQPFYQDPDLHPEESAPGKISDRTLHRARQCFPSCRTLDDDELAAVFGSVVTDPKAWLAPDGLQSDRPSAMRVHGMAKIAWHRAGSTRFVFANGHERQVDEQELGYFRDICSDSRLDVLPPAVSALDELTGWMLERGVFDLETAAGQGS